MQLSIRGFQHAFPAALARAEQMALDGAYLFPRG